MTASKSYTQKGNAQYEEVVEGTHNHVLGEHIIKEILYSQTKDIPPIEVITFIVDLLASDN